MDLSEVVEVVVVMLLMFQIRECLNSLQSKRRMCVRDLDQNSDECGLFATPFDQMYDNDPELFKKTVRMNKDVFNLLFSLVQESVTKNSNRPPIAAKCRLFLTLAYLAHGGAQHMYSTSFKMGRSTVNKIVKETCEVLWNQLGDIYLSVPDKHEWQTIANDFHTIWNLPNCVGAIDEKRITLTSPPNSSSLYNSLYKGTCSIILLASCDANYTFTNVDIGAYNSQSDGGVLWNSGFGQKLFNEELDLPEDDFLPGSDVKMPYFMVGDAAFPLKRCIMRPYPGLQLPTDRETFNKRLSRARQVIENAIGILTARWRILQSPLHMLPSSAESVVKATIVLHNFVKTHDGSYCNPDYVDHYQGDTVVNGLWRKDVATPLQRHGRMIAKNARKSAFALRDQLKEYICGHPL